MRRLRVLFWGWMFEAAVALSNVALLRRSRACGCAACTHVAVLTEAMTRARGMRMVKGPPSAHVHQQGLN